MPPGSSGPSVTSRFALVPSAFGMSWGLSPWPFRYSATKSISARLEVAAGRVERDQAVDHFAGREGGAHWILLARQPSAERRQPSRLEAGLPMMVRNSRRVSGSLRKAPSMVEVTIVTPGLWTPRVVMHWCWASMTTATPLGSSTLWMHVGDLGVHLFLHLQAAGVGFDDAGELGDADDAVRRQIADMRLADDRRQMVFAVRFEADVAQHDHLVVAVDLLEGALHVVFGVFVVAGEPILVGAGDAGRRVAQAFARRDRRRPSAKAFRRRASASSRDGRDWLDESWA